IEADDQAIQTILLGLPEDIYADVDSCETAQEIWLRVQQMMKGSDIIIQEKKAKLFNECNLKFLNNLQPEWSRRVTIVHQTKDLHTADYTQLYDFLKYNQKENVGNLNGYNAVQNVGNQVAQNAIQNLKVHNVGNQNGLIGDANQNGNGNPIAARVEGNASGIMQASTSGAQTDKAPVYDSDGSTEYTELLEPIPELHQVPQNDNNVISEDSSVEQSERTVEQHPANIEETRVLYDSLYNNLAIEVEKVNTVNRKLKETNAELTTELVRFKNQEKCFEISQEKSDKLERCYQKSVYQEQCLSKNINALHLSFGKQIMTLNEEISNLNKQLSKEKSTVSFLLEEKKKLKSDFKTREDELFDKQIQLEKKIKELDNILLKTGQSIQTIHMLSPKPDSFYHTEQKMALGYQNPFYLKQAQQKQ
nr:hypothetical protein [Tanacetum cinerariifolium]